MSESDALQARGQQPDFSVSRIQVSVFHDKGRAHSTALVFEAATSPKVKRPNRWSSAS